MGISAPKIAKSDSNTPYSETEQTDDDFLWENLIQTKECCGIVKTKVTRTKVTWQQRFIRNANQIKQEFPWAKDMIEMVNNCKLPKRQYIADINELKKKAYSQNPSQEKIDSQQEIEKVKKKLKNSAVVSLKGSNTSAADVTKSSLGSAIYKHNSRQRGEFSRYKNSLALNYPDRKFQKSVISKMSSSLKDSITEQPITRSTNYELDLFMKFTDILSRHLKDIFCILGRLQRLFIVYIQKTYRVYSTSQETIGSLVDDINQYLQLMKEAVIDYYRLGIFLDPEWHNSFLSNPENILSICNNLLFNDRNFYQVVFGNIAQFCKTNDSIFEEITKKIDKFTPEDFMVKEQFCLNLKTIHSRFKGLKREAQNSETQNTGIKMEEQIFKPYQECIMALRSISNAKSPLDKMKAILKCSQNITQAIEKFYCDNQLPKEKWLLDADQVLSIFCFIIAQAKVPNLHAHLFMLQQFSTSHQTMSMSGYYISVLSCGVQQIMLDNKSLLDQKQ